MHARASAILDLHDQSVYLPSTALTATDDLPYERQAAHFLSAQPFACIAQQLPIGDNTLEDDQSCGTAVELPLVNRAASKDAVSVFNPYPLYGQLTHRPRGLPLDLGAMLRGSVLSVDGVCPMNSSEPSVGRRLCLPVVQHFLADHFGDIDAVHAATGGRVPLNFLAPVGRRTTQHASRTAPAVAVPRGTYMPFNAHSTLFLPEVYAILALLPGSKLQPMADIARAYVMQAALTYSAQHHDYCVVVTPPTFAHVDNSSDTTDASSYALQMARMERLLAWLTRRQKGGSEQMNVSQQVDFSRPLFSRELLQWLYTGLDEEGELDEADAALFHAWLSDVSRMPHSAEVATHVQEESLAPTTDAPGESTRAESVAATLPLNTSSSDCFPSYSLPSVSLLSPSAPLNLPAQPDSVLASDGNTYSLSDYADGFLFPDKYAAGVSIDERPLHYVDPANVKPAGRWLPYPPHRHPPKPRVDFILRAFSGYSPLTSALLRSLDSFVPWRQLGDVIVVLDDSDADRNYAASLPDDVKVHFEPKPAFFAEWGSAVQQTGALGVARQANGYALGVYSNWVSDRYSEADYICVLDPDMLFVSRGGLPLMFDWDEQQRLYKPVWICRDTPEAIFVQSSYKLFGLDATTAPGCMYQLPVCIHRSTLRRVRLHLNADFHRLNSTDYSQYGLEPVDDRDSDYEQYGRRYDVKRAEVNSVLPTRVDGVAPTAFDRTYMRMVNRDLGHAVCQFCVWGSYILTRPAERLLYSLHLQGNKDNSSECPQLRAATHSGYLVPQPKMSPAYYQLADRLLMEGACRSALPTDCIVPVCAARAQWYDALSARSAGTVPAREVLRQELLLKWELQGMFLDGQHDRRCRAYAMSAVQQLYEWVQQFDLAPKPRRDRHCARIALAQSATERSSRQ